MTFNAIFMSQLGKKPKPLREEIGEILAGSEQPMNCIDIFNRSKVAITSRDISLELVKMNHFEKSVFIDEMRERPGFRAVAHWTLTEKGRDIYSVQNEEMLCD